MLVIDSLLVNGIYQNFNSSLCEIFRSTIYVLAFFPLPNKHKKIEIKILKNLFLLSLRTFKRSKKYSSDNVLYCCILVRRQALDSLRKVLFECRESFFRWCGIHRVFRGWIVKLRLHKSIFRQKLSLV